jgi:hypothetical protein
MPRLEGSTALAFPDVGNPGTHMRRPLIDPTLEGDEVAPEPGYEWIRIAAHVERLAPENVSVDELARVEDAAAEWLYQRSLDRTIDLTADDV